MGGTAANRIIVSCDLLTGIDGNDTLSRPAGGYTLAGGTGDDTIPGGRAETSVRRGWDGHLRRRTWLKQRPWRRGRRPPDPRGRRYGDRRRGGRPVPVCGGARHIRPCRDHGFQRGHGYGRDRLRRRGWRGRAEGHRRGIDHGRDDLHRHPCRRDRHNPPRRRGRPGGGRRRGHPGIRRVRHRRRDFERGRLDGLRRRDRSDRPRRLTRPGRAACVPHRRGAGRHPAQGSDQTAG